MDKKKKTDPYLVRHDSPIKRSYIDIIREIPSSRESWREAELPRPVKRRPKRSIGTQAD